MKRYPPFEPPEYLSWKPDAAVLKAYRATAAQVEIKKALQELGAPGIERMYKGLVRNRLYDITLHRWVRTSVLSKAWLGVGEEAVTIGAVHALEPADVVGPMIRNAAACFEKGISLEDCLRVYLATGDTVTQGRDLHIGDLRHNVVSPVSLVGDLVPVMVGFALAFRMRKEERVALTWVGDGATRTGAFHEGLAMAVSLSAPLIVVVQNNGVALGTACDERLGTALRHLPESYSAKGFECEGNHVLDVYRAVQAARRLCVAGEGPVLIHAETFRMGGHATHDDREARALFGEDKFAHWGARDPIGCFEEFLATEKNLLGENPHGENLHRGKARTLLAKWEKEVAEEIGRAEELAMRSRSSNPASARGMTEEVFARE